MTAPVPRKDHTVALIVAALVILALLLAAGLLLAAAHWKPESIAGLLAAVGTAVGVAFAALAKLLQLDAKQDQQNQVLTQITHQTNGLLNARIQDAVDQMVNRVTAATSTPEARDAPREPQIRDVPDVQQAA